MSVKALLMPEQIAGLNNHSGVPRSSFHSRALSAQDVRRLVVAGGNRQHSLILKTLLCSSATVGEFVGLQVTDFSAPSGTLRVGLGGRSKPRVVPLPDHLVNELRRHVGRRKSGPLFVSRRGGALSARRVQQLIHGQGKLAGLGRVTPTLLRFAFGRDLVQRGMPLDHVQALLGHHRLHATQVGYADLPSVEQVRESFDRIGSSLSAVAP